MYSFICVPKKEYMEKAMRKAYELGFSQSFHSFSGGISDTDSLIDICIKRFMDHWDVYKEKTAIFLDHKNRSICYGDIFDEDDRYENEEIFINFDTRLFDDNKDFLL